MTTSRTIDRDHDLDLAVELVNTYWVLADPPDRLTDVAAFQAILRESGDDELAGELRPADLDELRRLRAQVAAIFGKPLDQAAAYLEEMLAAARIPVQIAVHNERTEWASGSQGTGMAALRGRLLVALADQLVRHGTARLGVCDAAPCNCVYVDRSRARTRRYCCDQCNDRAAAAAYRRRRASSADRTTSGRHSS
jgi:predicted RNA-binding Zn ribbon-like protein